MSLENFYNSNSQAIDALFSQRFRGVDSTSELQGRSMTSDFVRDFKTSYWIINSGRFTIGSNEDILNVMLAIGNAARFHTEQVKFVKYVPFMRGGQQVGTTRVVVEESPPATIGEADRQKIFNSLILPLIKNYYNTAILPNTQIDAITKRIIGEWWSNSQSSLFSEFAKLSETVESKEFALGQKFKILGNDFNNDFFDELISPTTVSAPPKIVLEHIGLAQFIVDNDQSPIGIERYGANIGTLEYQRKQGLENFKELAEEALGAEGELSLEDRVGLEQCALMTGLLHSKGEASSFKFDQYWQDKRYNSPLYKDPANNGDPNKDKNYRIYPVTQNGFNPTSLVNYATINKRVKEIFTNGDTKKPDAMIKGLFWVYEEMNKEGQDSNTSVLREAELSLSSKMRENKLVKIRNRLGEENEDINTVITENYQKKSSFYYLENTRVVFDGTNPSTARKDVQVTMTWKMGSMEGLESVIATLSEEDGQPAGTEVKLRDLITLPLTKKPSMSDGPGQYVSTQYSPNYSRVRLKMAPFGDDEASHRHDTMILDLSIIDHEISRESETGQTTLTINYKGYFEATLAMPFNDALADRKTIQQRLDAQRSGIDILKNGNCDPKLVRDAIRIEQKNLEISSKKDKLGSILRRLAKRKLIHTYEIDEFKLSTSTIGARVDSRNKLINKVTPARAQEKLDFEKLENLGQEKEEAGLWDSVTGFFSEDENSDEAIKKSVGNKFFFLGDLMWVVLDCLYKENSAEHEDHVKSLNLKFIVGTINIANPKDPSGPPIVINPLSMPIDVIFFTQWFNSTVVKKGLTSYPVGTFIRDLIERLVNGVIYDTCFSLLLPDENPPVLRPGFFTSSEKSWFLKNKKGELNPKDPFQDGKPPDLLFPKKIVTEQNAADKTSIVIADTNYCMIYQQFPSFKRQLMAESNKTLKEDDYTPTIYYGAKNTENNFLSNVSFSKTDSPFLREARYFNSSFGDLTLLSNVYDLSFSLVKRKANTMFYPGGIINFLLLDWGDKWTKLSPPWESPVYGQSDPHQHGTSANIMGLGGYFTIKSVEYNLGELPTEFEIKTSLIYYGSDADRPVGRDSDQTKNIEEEEKCVGAYNSIVTRYNETASENPDIDASQYESFTSVTSTDGGSQ